MARVFSRSDRQRFEELLGGLDDEAPIFPRLRRAAEEHRDGSVPKHAVQAALAECLAFLFLRLAHGADDKALAAEIVPIAWVMGYLYGLDEGRSG